MLTILSQIDIDDSDLNIPKATTPDNIDQLSGVIELVSGIMGAIAVLVIVIAGVMFILSRGDPQKSATARNAIIYASIGLVIAILSFSIVRFVVRAL